MEEEEIERIYFKSYTKNEWPTEKNIGRVKDLPEATEKYIDYIKTKGAILKRTIFTKIEERNNN